VQSIQRSHTDEIKAISNKSEKSTADCCLHNGNSKYQRDFGCVNQNSQKCTRSGGKFPFQSKKKLKTEAFEQMKLYKFIYFIALWIDPSN
jgi:hypothetical protein